MAFKGLSAEKGSIRPAMWEVTSAWPYLVLLSYCHSSNDAGVPQAACCRLQRMSQPQKAVAYGGGDAFCSAWEVVLHGGPLVNGRIVELN